MTTAVNLVTEVAWGDRSAHSFVDVDLLNLGTLRELLEVSPNSVVAIDPTGVIRYVNYHVLATHGYERSELIGQRIEFLVPSKLFILHTHQPAIRPMGIGLDLDAKRKDGSYFPVEVTFTPVVTKSGTWVFAVLVDVTAARASASRIQQLSRVYLTLAQANDSMGHVTNPAQLFQNLCKVIVEQGGFLGAWVGQPNQVGELQVLAAAGSFADDLSQVQSRLDAGKPKVDGPTATALREGRSYYCTRFMTDPVTLPWRKYATEYGIRSSATILLHSQGVAVAALTMYSADEDIFDTEMRSMIELLARNASRTLEALQTKSELQSSLIQGSRLMDRFVEAQELERAQIAGNIHDDSVQALAAVDLRLALLQRQIAVAAPELDDSVRALQATIAGATERLRELLFDLEPADAAITIGAGLSEIAARIFAETRLLCEVNVPLEPVMTTGGRTQALWLATEALTNIRSHSHASMVTVNVAAGASGTEFVISDNGVGLDPETVRSPSGHRGLATMRDRAEIAGGWFRLEGSPREGTTVRFWIPRALYPLNSASAA